MAIADIISRIEDDAQAEAGAIIAAAQERADAKTAAARSGAERDATRIKTRGADAARVEAETLLANARLAARDAFLSARKELAEQVLAGVREALEVLPDDEYAAFIARETARVAVPGQCIRIAAADAGRLADIGSLVASHGIEMPVVGEVADLAHGVRVEGDGVSAEVSPAAYVAEHHGDMLQVAVRELFPEEG
ncbi:MAG: V-type ATP synthase subunit E family protein [Coriobacteriia bacterium]|nr:V-type ATP synthase subunit E family protein [Coriobacteriia bacterium]